ncbi:MAG: 2-phospho-L-lactate guanylyltransferase [Terriglobales bacterium]
MILVPIKNLQHAKQRLAPVLEAGERSALAQAMMDDVFTALAQWRNHPPVAVVTGDALARERARDHGFEIIADGSNRGETDAIALATQACQARGVGWTLVVPADVPLVQSPEFEHILQAAPPEGTVLVPSCDGRGTNAVLRRPAALFPLRFGDDSFLPHRRAAEATGKPLTVLELPGLALDVDRPADLHALLMAEGECRAQRLLRSWNLGERLVAAHHA